MLIALAAETTAAADEAGGAFPPFDPWHWEAQAFWLVVTFVLLYVVLSRLILPRFASTIERRGTQIATDLDEAARLNEEAQEAQQALEIEMAKARSKARETAAEAQAKIEAKIASETAKADARIEAKLEEAEADIAALREQEMAQVEGIAVETVKAITGRLGAKVKAADAKRAVKAALDA